MAGQDGARMELDRLNPVIDADLHLPLDDEAMRSRLPERMTVKGTAISGGNWDRPFQELKHDGSNDPSRLPAKFLDRTGIDIGILTGNTTTTRLGVHPDTQHAAALARAWNEWLIEEVLPTDDRYRGSLALPLGQSEAAVAEIDRFGGDERVVQAIAGAGTRVALGDERYWPIFEALTSRDLPLALHAGAEGHGIAHPNTGAGYPRLAVEAQSVAPATFMGQLLNMILEGVFVEYPELTVVMMGAGYGWMPSFLWRTDKAWKGLTDDYPWLDRPPSEYVREHVRFVTYPVVEATESDRQELLCEMAWADETVIFGSHYPYPDGYRPGEGLETGPEAYRAAIFGETAATVYDL